MILPLADSLNYMHVVRSHNSVLTTSIQGQNSDVDSDYTDVLTLMSDIDTALDDAEQRTSSPTKKTGRRIKRVTFDEPPSPISRKKFT